MSEGRMMATNSDPRQVWRKCDRCSGTGRATTGALGEDGGTAIVGKCHMCKGHGGWWVSEPFPAEDPNRESAGAWHLCALGLLCVAVAIAAGVA
jgi:hypothetical protein